MPNARRGEVWQVDFGIAAKVRPALVLGCDVADEDRMLATVVYHTTSLRDSRYEVPSYGLANASVRYETKSGKWATTLFVNNLTDEVYANNAQAFGRGFWTVGGPTGIVGPFAAPRNAIADYRARPREVGLTFQYNFH